MVLSFKIKNEKRLDLFKFSKILLNNSLNYVCDCYKQILVKKSFICFENYLIKFILFVYIFEIIFKIFGIFLF